MEKGRRKTHREKGVERENQIVPTKERGAVAAALRDGRRAWRRKHRGRGKEDGIGRVGLWRGKSPARLSYEFSKVSIQRTGVSETGDRAQEKSGQNPHRFRSETTASFRHPSSIRCLAQAIHQSRQQTTTHQASAFLASAPARSLLPCQHPPEDWPSVQASANLIRSPSTAPRDTGREW